jgi:NAD-dependent DNA ligase
LPDHAGRRRRWAEHFTALEALLAADEEFLATIPGISPAAARNIRSFFDSSGGRKLLAELLGLGLLVDEGMPAAGHVPEGGHGKPL